MKMKNNRTLLFGIPLLFLVSPMVLSSCSLLNINTNNNSPIEDSKNDSNDENTNTNTMVDTYSKINNFQFISERTFSLKFVSSENPSVGYGTGWIFAKDKEKLETYYIATNLHVASFIANAGKQIYEPYYNGSTKGYKQVTHFKYDEIHFGQIFNIDKNNNVIVGTKNQIEDLNKTKYVQKVGMENVSIAYTTFDMFNKMQLYNQSNNYNDEIVKNATQDLAILKIDFSKRKYVNTYLNTIDPIRKSLDAYDKHPTRFANSYNPKKDEITVAGFPAKQNYGRWQSSSNNISTTALVGQNASNSSWRDWLDDPNISTNVLKEKYAIVNNIVYSYNGYASQMNVSLQQLFNNFNLEGGSSGSMVINKNNEVVGIYWGGYNFSNGNHMSGIDVFINDNIYHDYTNQNIILKPYNTLNDFKSKIQNTTIV